MQIKIEIDVKPEELRRFLGLPDVAGLQDEVIQFLRDKVGAAGENFDPSAFVRGNLDLLKRTPAWRKLVETLGPREPASAPPPSAAPPRKRAARKHPSKKSAVKTAIEPTAD